MVVFSVVISPKQCNICFCIVLMQIWERVFVWLDLQLMLPHNTLSLLNYVATIPGTKQFETG
jgi:hypothetical protein